MQVSNYDDEGLMNLAIAIIDQARDDYKSDIEDGYIVMARILADRDSRGLIGYILQWLGLSKDTLFDMVDSGKI